MGTNDDKQPFHSGEIYYLWSYLHETKENIVTVQVLKNHTEDENLQVLLNDMLENIFTEEEQQVESMLKEAGIRLPPAPPDRPNVNLQDIPAGARFSDSEIARLIQKELLAGKLKNSYINGMSNQEMIKSLFEEFHAERTEYELKLAKTIKEKGWYVSPPVNLK